MFDLRLVRREQDLYPIYWLDLDKTKMQFRQRHLLVSAIRRRVSGRDGARCCRVVDVAISLALYPARLPFCRPYF